MTSIPRTPTGYTLTAILQVNVLYLNVPPDMRGGTLTVTPTCYLDAMKAELRRCHTEDAARVIPKANKMVEFRGDALHSVGQFRSPSGGERVGLVLEQYM